MIKLVDLELNFANNDINNSIGIKITECVGINLTSLRIDLKYN